jgi:hypothetical protein
MHLSWLNTNCPNSYAWCSLGSKKKDGRTLYYSIRLKISVAFASRETTLTKYILKNINIYDT